MTTLKKEQGIGLIESIVSLLIITTLLAVSSSWLSQMFKLSSNSSREEQNKLLAENVLRSFSSGFKNSEKLYSIKGHAIHLNSDLSLKKYNPKSGSNSVSFISLEPDLQLSVTAYSATSGNTSLCLFHSNRAKRDRSLLTKSKSWIALSLDSYFLLEGKIKKAPNSAHCPKSNSYQGTLSKIKNSSFQLTRNPDENSISAHTPLQVIPIREAYTLLLDSKNTLRRISLSSRENQPLEHNVQGIRVDTIRHDESIIQYLLSIDVKHPSTKNLYSIERIFSLENYENHDHLNLLL